MSGQQKQQIINGYIVTVPRGEADASIHVALHTDNGDEFFILPKGMGIDLVEHVNARAEVSGIVEQRDEAHFILVRNYTVKDGFEDDWYDDND